MVVIFDFAMTPRCIGLLSKWEGFLIYDSTTWIQLGQYFMLSWIKWDKKKRVWSHTPAQIPVPTYACFRASQYSSFHLTEIDQNPLGLTIQFLSELEGQELEEGPHGHFNMTNTCWGHGYSVSQLPYNLVHKSLRIIWYILPIYWHLYVSPNKVRQLLNQALYLWSMRP